MATFGEAMAARVEAFQRARGLKITGAVGPETWGKLAPPETEAKPATIDGESGAFLEELLAAPSFAEFFGLAGMEQDEKRDG